MDRIVTGLPVVLSQDVGLSTHLAGDVVLDTRPLSIFKERSKALKDDRLIALRKYNHHH